RLDSLAYLNLRQTNVTDEAVDTLIAMASLQGVNLSGTRITPRALDRLRRARPELTVETAQDETAGTRPTLEETRRFFDEAAENLDLRQGSIAPPGVR